MIGLNGGGGGGFRAENCEERGGGDVPFGRALGATSFGSGAAVVVVVVHDVLLLL
jgi:hypothetical protein